MKRLKKGFTLIELMIVVAIIAILAAVAAPKFGSQIKKAKDAKGVSLLGTWRSSSNLYYADNEDYATNVGALASSVDSSAKKTTFSTLAGGDIATSSGTALFVEVGTSNSDFTGGTASGKPALQATYTTDGAITVNSGQGNDTKNIAWEQY